MGRGETEEFVHFLFREGFLKKGSRMECYDFHSITPSLSYFIQKNSENPTNGCHTLVSTHSSLALKKQSHYPHNGKNLNFSARQNLKDENIDLNLQKAVASSDSSKSAQADSQKQFDDWRAYDIGIGLLLYGETACFVLARMIELAYMGVGNCGFVTCCVLCQGLSCLESESRGISVGNGVSQSGPGAHPGGSEVCVGQKIPRRGVMAELPVGVVGNVFLLNPYLDVGEIQAIIELEVSSSNSVKQVFACRSDLVELGMGNFELSTKTPCFLLAVKCSIDLTLPIYVYKRSADSSSHSLRTLREGSIVVGRDFQFSLETLMSLYTWLKNHLLNPKSPFFDLDYGKFYYSRALELLSNIEYVVRVSGGAEKAVSPVGGNINLNDVGLGICGGGSGFSRQFGISKFRTPNSRCSISTAASANTPASVGDVRTDLPASKTTGLCPGGPLPGGGEVPVQGGGIQGAAGTQDTISAAGQDYGSQSASARGKRNSVKFTSTITPGQNTSTAASTLVPGTIVRFRSQIPVDAKLIQGVPETDYFTHVQQVYYHFQKGEWRAVYGPSKNRQQKSFSVNKYGFYEAKRLAEEWRLRYLYSNPNGTNSQQNAAYGKCMQCGEGADGTPGSNVRSVCTCKYGPNGTHDGGTGTQNSGGNTKCKTGRKRRSSRVEVDAGGGDAGKVASSQGGCIPTKVPNKGGGVCGLEGTSSYAPSKMGGETLREVSNMVAGNVRDAMGGGSGVSKTMMGVESRSPRMAGQGGAGGGGGAGATEDSVYSPMDGMIAFGNAEFSATISEQKPCAGKLPLMSSQSPKSKQILHPAIPGGRGTTGFLGPDPGFKNPTSHNNGRNLSVNPATPTSNTPGGLSGGAGACVSSSIGGGLGYDQVQKPFEEDKLLSTIPSYGGVGMLPAGSVSGTIRAVGGASKLASSPSLGRIISSASSNTTSSSTPMMISEASSPSISSPVSVGANSCSNIISPDKQQPMLTGAGEVAGASSAGSTGANTAGPPSGANTAGVGPALVPMVSGRMHPVSEQSYSIAPDTARGGVVYPVQPGTPSSSQGDGMLGKGSVMISQTSQGGHPIGFPASVRHYQGHFSASMPVPESSYGCISPVIKDGCWNSASNEAMTSSPMGVDSSFPGGMVAASTPRSPSSAGNNVACHPSVNSGGTSVGAKKSGANGAGSVSNSASVLAGNDGGVMDGGCLSMKVSGKESVNSGCLGSSVGKDAPASVVVVGSGGSVGESSGGKAEGDCGGGRSNSGGGGGGVDGGNVNNDSVAGASMSSVNGGENSDRRNGGSDASRSGNGGGNPWMKRNAWDEDLIIDSFFVG